MATKAQTILAVARKYLGTTETPPGSNRTQFGEWYGQNGVAWCAMFVSFCAAQAGIPITVIPKFAWTPAGAEFYKAKNRWGSTPRVGAVVFYDIAGMGRISHTGLVESVLPDGSWWAIEGNTNGSGSRTGGEVWRQHRRTVGQRGGFGYPAYPEIPAPTAVAAPAVLSGSGSSTGGPPYPGTLLRRGSKGDAVRAMQARLNVHLLNGYGKGITTDGDYGPATEAAVRWYQECRRGAPYGLSVDGVVGPATWRSLWL
jgi:hypothetical protein